MNEGGNFYIPAGGWTYTATVFPDNPGGGGITKFGSRRLTIQGAGTYSGSNQVVDGILRVQNDTALGRSSTGHLRGHRHVLADRHRGRSGERPWS